MSTYQAKDSQVQSRQLEAQTIEFNCNLVAGSSDLPTVVTVDNSTLATTLITLAVLEPLTKCYFAEVRNRITGAVVPLLAAPLLTNATVVTPPGPTPSSTYPEAVQLSVNGTALTDCFVRITFKIEE
jgi:hypothetical protein